MTRYIGDTNGHVTKGEGDDPLAFLSKPAGGLVKDFEQDIERAIAESIELEAAKIRFGNPASAGLEVRREGGIIKHDNPQDRQRAEALKANHDRPILAARHLKDLGDFAVSGEEYVLDAISYLTKQNAKRPPEFQPIGRALTSLSAKVLAGQFGEHLKMLAERGTQEINLATKPGQKA